MQTFATYEERRRQQIQVLVDLGIAKYVNATGLYHGRAGDGSDWEVIPGFNNAANETGNNNVYDVSGLYASDSQLTATQFAKRRLRRNDQQPEVHKIVGKDSDEVVFNLNFDWSTLSQQQRVDLEKALATLTHFHVTEALPVRFEYKAAYELLQRKFGAYRQQYPDKYYFDDQDIEIVTKSMLSDASDKDNMKKIFEGSSVKFREFVKEYISSFNTIRLLQRNPLCALSVYMNNLDTFTSNKKSYSLNPSYVSAWASNNHIVGIEQKVDSVTVNSTIDAYTLFDTKKILSEKQYGEMMQEVMTTYGALTSNLINVIDSENADFLTKSSSRETMEFIEQSPECKELFDKDAGIWEKWTIGQHTQAVLDFFEDNYSENFPTELKPFIKVVILAHDIGKGYAKENNIDQKVGNLQKSKILYDALNITDDYRGLIDFIISTSQEYTTNIIMKRGEKSQNLEKLRNMCAIAYVKAFDKQPTEEELIGLVKICTTLQTCDSGAYTRYAKIKNQDGSYVGGGNDRFTSSFTKNERGDYRLKELLDD